MNQTMHMLFVLLVAWLMHCSTVAGKSDDEVKEDIDEFIEELRACYDVHGNNLAIVNDGQVSVYTCIQLVHRSLLKRHVITLI